MFGFFLFFFSTAEGQHNNIVTYYNNGIKEIITNVVKTLTRKTNEPVRNFQIVYSLKQYFIRYNILYIIFFLITYWCTSWTESKSSHDRFCSTLYPAYSKTFFFFSLIHIGGLTV